MDCVEIRECGPLCMYSERGFAFPLQCSPPSSIPRNVELDPRGHGDDWLSEWPMLWAATIRRRMALEGIAGGRLSS
jgi:hypothetical protein